MKAPSWGCHHDCFAVRLCSSLGYALFKVPAPRRFVLGWGGCAYTLETYAANKLRKLWLRQKIHEESLHARRAVRLNSISRTFAKTAAYVRYREGTIGDMETNTA